MLVALLLAALPQQGWVVEELPQPPPSTTDIVVAGPDLIAVGGGIHRLRADATTWTRIAEAPSGVSPTGFRSTVAGDWLVLPLFRMDGNLQTTHFLDLTTAEWSEPLASPPFLPVMAYVAGQLIGLAPGGALELSVDGLGPPQTRQLAWPVGAGGEEVLMGRDPGVAVQGAGAGGDALYVMGGFTPVEVGVGAPQSDAWKFAPDKGQWIRLPDLPEADAYGPVSFGATELLLFGSTCWSFNTVTAKWVDRGTALLPSSPSSTMVRWGERIVQLTIEPDGAPPKLLALSLPKSEAALGTVDLVVLIGYLVVLVGLGAWFSRREKNTEDFFLAGRRIPWWAAGLSLFATQLSAITFLGTPAVSYATDWMLLPSWFGILFFAPLAVKIFLPLYRRRPMRTVYTWLEWRYGVPVRLFGSFSFIVFQLLRMGVVVYLPSLALSTATGVEVWQCVLLMGVLATVYTVLGGMEAVIWTDVLQTCVLLLGVGATLWVVFSALGDPGAAWASAVEAGKLRTVGGGWSTVEAATWSLILGGLFLQFGPYTADQAMVQRYLTTKDEKAAARGIWLNGWMSVPAGALFILVGTALWLYYRAHPEALDLGLETDAVFPLFLARELPTGISGLVIAGLFAAAMSTLDSGMHAIATTCTTDWYERLSGRTATLRQARGATVVAGVTATAVALLLASSGILSSLLFFLKTLGLLTSGVAGVFLLGVLSKRAHTAGALVGAAVGIGMLAQVAFMTPTDLFVYPLVGIPTTVCAGWLASRILPGRPGAAAA